MRIIAREERSDKFSHDHIYYLSSISTSQDVKEILTWLVSEDYVLHAFSMYFIHDHADFRPPQNFETQEALLKELNSTEFSWLNSIIIKMSKGTHIVHATIYPATDVVRFSYPRKP